MRRPVTATGAGRPGRRSSLGVVAAAITKTGTAMTQRHARPMPNAFQLEARLPPAVKWVCTYGCRDFASAHSEDAGNGDGRAGEPRRESHGDPDQDDRGDRPQDDRRDDGTGATEAPVVQRHEHRSGQMVPKNVASDLLRARPGLVAVSGPVGSAGPAASSGGAQDRTSGGIRGERLARRFPPCRRGR